MNTSVRIAAALALIVACQAMAASLVEYKLELGGNNRDVQWEAGQAVDYGQAVNGGNDGQTFTSTRINWAVLVKVSGAHSGGLGGGFVPGGVANAVFDLELKNNAGATVALGHASPANNPSGAGWYSTINDGDADGARGAGGTNPDPEHNAAFAISYNIANARPPDIGGRVFDPLNLGGPFVNYAHYPSATGLPAAAVNCNGRLIGMGAGYSSFDPVSNAGGVGLVASAASCTALGEKVVFEGQISMVGLGAGTYTLHCTSAAGTNVLIDLGDTCLFGLAGQFAEAPNSVAGDTITF
ncbi:MAG TPA: hypothetical protein VLM89_09260, partial [Phycisphaerae bacterium]|nr:hypothetical protein [Phycisphaerae bacterium]